MHPHINVWDRFFGIPRLQHVTSQHVRAGLGHCASQVNCRSARCGSIALELLQAGAHACTKERVPAAAAAVTLDLLQGEGCACTARGRRLEQAHVGACVHQLPLLRGRTSSGCTTFCSSSGFAAVSCAELMSRQAVRMRCRATFCGCSNLQGAEVGSTQAGQVREEAAWVR